MDHSACSISSQKLSGFEVALHCFRCKLAIRWYPSLTLSAKGHESRHKGRFVAFACWQAEHCEGLVELEGCVTLLIHAAR
eukprot:g42066.t1